MFDLLKAAVAKLDGTQDDFKSYKNATLARKHLKAIMVECNGLRKQVLSLAKAANPKLFKGKG